MVDDTLSLLLTFLVCTFTCFITLDLYKKRRLLLFSSQNRGYRFYPIIGNGYHFHGLDAFKSMRKLVDTHKLPCNLWAGQDYYYVTDDPAEIQLVLNDDSTVEKAEYYMIMKNMVNGNTLLVEPHDVWKEDRRLFSKSFSPRVLNNLVDLFYKKSCWLVEKSGEELKLSLDTLDVFTLSIVTDSFAGQGQFTRRECYDMANTLEILEDIVGRRFFSKSYYPDILHMYSQEGRTSIKHYKKLYDALCKIIRNKKEGMSKIEQYPVDIDELPLIEQIIRSTERMSDDTITRQLILFILASIHTTAASLLTVFVLLGMHPEVQEKVYQEVVDTVGLTNVITQSDLPNLKYTEMAIYECMRILPTVPFTGRYASYDLNLGTKTLPAGSNVLINIFHLHRSEKYWKDPLKYDPDRFLPENKKNRHPYSFIPFSRGPKNCIGLKYAMMVLKVAVANVIRNYHIHSSYKSIEDIPLSGSVVLKISGDLKYSMTRRS